MKNYLIGFVPAVLLAIAVVTYINDNNTSSIKEKDQARLVQFKNSSDAEKDSCCKMELKAGSHSDNSIYNLASCWEDENGNSVDLKKFEGEKVILAMIYTSCPTACPVIVSNMQRLESAIPQGKRGNYHFVLVSIDPKRDTPKRLNQFASERKLDTKTWTLLTGSENDVAELAELIGFNYKKDSNGNFTHSNLITFLDRQGVIMNQSEGLNQSSEKLLTMLNKQN